MSDRKLPELRAAIERATAMQAWLETASGCTSATPEECTLFTDADGARADLEVVQVAGAAGCRRSG